MEQMEDALNAVQLHTVDDARNILARLDEGEPSEGSVEGEDEEEDFVRGLAHQNGDNLDHDQELNGRDGEDEGEEEAFGGGDDGDNEDNNDRFPDAGGRDIQHEGITPYLPTPSKTSYQLELASMQLRVPSSSPASNIKERNDYTAPSYASISDFALSMTNFDKESKRRIDFTVLKKGTKPAPPGQNLIGAPD